MREGEILARGTPDELRERTHTDDLAEAFLRLIELTDRNERRA